MKLVDMINEVIGEEFGEVWYHGTPDIRDLNLTGNFTQKTNTTDYISDPKKWNVLQSKMGVAKKTNNEDEYFNLLDQAGALRKNMTYTKPTFFTSNINVAKTYADPQRAFDYQGSEPKTLKVKINDNGNVLSVPAYGERFRNIKSDIVKKSLKNKGVSDDTINNVFGMLTTNIRNGVMTADTLGIIAQEIGFDIVDVIGVLDSYNGGNIKSTVRMVFDPSRISIMN